MVCRVLPVLVRILNNILADQSLFVCDNFPRIYPRNLTEWDIITLSRISLALSFHQHHVEMLNIFFNRLKAASRIAWLCNTSPGELLLGNYPLDFWTSPVG